MGQRLLGEGHRRHEVDVHDSLVGLQADLGVRPHGVIVRAARTADDNV